MTGVQTCALPISVVRIGAPQLRAQFVIPDSRRDGGFRVGVRRGVGTSGGVSGRNQGLYPAWDRGADAIDADNRSRPINNRLPAIQLAVELRGSAERYAALRPCKRWNALRIAACRRCGKRLVAACDIETCRAGPGVSRSATGQRSLKSRSFRLSSPSCVSGSAAC